MQVAAERITPNTVGSRLVNNTEATSAATSPEVKNYFTNNNSKQTKIPPIVKSKDSKQ
jgi:hypothetical protein